MCAPPPAQYFAIQRALEYWLDEVCEGCPCLGPWKSCWYQYEVQVLTKYRYPSAQVQGLYYTLCKTRKKKKPPSCSVVGDLPETLAGPLRSFRYEIASFPHDVGTDPLICFTKAAIYLSLNVKAKNFTFQAIFVLLFKNEAVAQISWFLMQYIILCNWVGWYCNLFFDTFLSDEI